MNSMVFRLGAVIAIVAMVQGGFYFVGKLGEAPEVIQPRQPLRTFPHTVEVSSTKWQGVDEKLDSRTFSMTEAELAVSRRYRDREGHVVTVFLAQYPKVSVGLYHSPMNCYRTNGYSLIEESRRPLKTPDRPDGEVKMSIWEKGNERVMVVYWYEVADYTMFERGDLLPVQWKMRGSKAWPVMIKVLLEVPASDSVQAQSHVMEMAQYIRQWLGTIKPSLDSN